MSLLHLQNMKLVIFDFDGTVADTSEGIIDAHKYTLQAMNRKVPNDDILRGIIGGNLLKTYKNKFEFDDENAKMAVKIYRKRYEDVGIHKMKLYSGFEEMIKSLKDTGYFLGIATLKSEVFVKIMLKELGIDKYFDCVCGMDINDELDKADLVLKCIKECGVYNNETVLVGDSKNDLLGAEKAGVNFIGVTYGFGFKTNENYTFKTVDDTKMLLSQIVNL